MAEDHDRIIELEGRIRALESTVELLQRERDRAIWGLLVTALGVIGSGVVYIWSTHR